MKIADSTLPALFQPRIRRTTPKNTVAGVTANAVTPARTAPNSSAPFSIKDTGDNLQGQVRSSGIFVNENGTVGTIQQLDLVA